ncbi:DUF1289 domain-containing protein [Methylobacterium nonmethylotrophicum]|uniref:DUF1289 domain-containing protein n=1 Tax=Methylobacterium nonmethylotrophicum TaxID=1141884 RepID=A0A4Z0NXW0_9HYPH|nr:DUF1289 domain-containing protein [Methylobacterium nonmethylotrophicum]TGE02689.1 DUF1289 domain-containing protein [Methylobacterium nonmethylotrophicum]
MPVSAPPVSDHLISTPCIRLCVLDPVTGLCEGCGRSGDEIAAWGALAEPERRRIMAELPARLSALAPEPAPAPALA